MHRVLEIFLNVFHKYNALYKYIINATTTAINTGKKSYLTLVKGG